MSIFNHDEELVPPHSAGYLNNTIVLTNSVILLSLSNAPRNLFPHYEYPFY